MFKLIPSIISISDAVSRDSLLVALCGPVFHVKTCALLNGGKPDGRPNELHPRRKHLELDGAAAAECRVTYYPTRTLALRSDTWRSLRPPANDTTTDSLVIVCGECETSKE